MRAQQRLAEESTITERPEESTRRNLAQITQLRSFVAVARIGSLTGAAQELAYTEPAIHLQLAALGRALGGKLFVRGRGRMELTPLGEAILPHAISALRAIDEMVAVAELHGAREERRVRIGVGRSTGSYLFPHLVAAVQERHPEIRLEPCLMPVGDLYQALVDGKLDLVYASGLRDEHRRAGLGGRSIVTVPFRRYYWYLVTSPRLAKALDADCEVRVFLPEYASALVPRLKAILPHTYVYSFELAQDAEATKGAALADMGIACVPAYTVGFEIAAQSLVRALPTVSPLASMIYLGHERPAKHPDVARVVNATRRLPSFFMDELAAGVGTATD